MSTDKEHICFQCNGGPGFHPQSWDGRLRMLKTGELCEAELEARGSYFHLIVGRHTYGNFVCIPNWNVGTEVSGLDDVFWNTERLQNNTSLKKVDVCSVATALIQISKINQLPESRTGTGENRHEIL